MVPRKTNWCLRPLDDRGPLRVLFLVTSMPVGGAETLLVNLVRRLDRRRFSPQLACLKQRGPLGEMLSDEIPVHAELLSHKYDLRVLPRLCRLMTDEQIDAVVTVGAGDKMFWGRLAAWRARVPVVLSALHSTGWPDKVGRLNRLLTPLTDRFVAVAATHARHLTEVERFPELRVCVIPNGVDCERFQPAPGLRQPVRSQLGLPADARVATIVAALRPEKNHTLFLEVAAAVSRRLDAARFLIVGDGPLRAGLEQQARTLGLGDRVQFLGTRADVERILAASDLFVLTSHNEANPVSILEAMAVGLPVVAPQVGSVADVVRDGETGRVVPRGEPEAAAAAWCSLLDDRPRSRHWGWTGRQTVCQRWSLEKMVTGYEQLMVSVYQTKHAAQGGGRVLGGESPLPARPAEAADLAS
jgi:glycosyltransferase involved in cell wall biosynthesis